MKQPRFPPAPLALVALALLASAPARGQFATPRAVDDIDMPAPQPAVPAAIEEEESAPEEEADEPEARPARGADEEVYIPGRTDDEAKRRQREREERLQALEPAPDAGAPPEAAAAQEEEAPPSDAKPIVLPPKDGEAKLLALFAERRKALEARDFKSVQDLEQRLVELRDELGHENLFALAGAIAGEAEAIIPTDSAEALRQALFAARLAPLLPHAHWTAARAAWRDDAFNVGRIFGSGFAALKASLAEPRWRSALVGEAASALLVALLIAGALIVGLLFLRRARFVLHDFHHLFPAGAHPAQSATIALVGLALFGLAGWGVFPLLAALALASWAYLSRAERVVVAAYLVLLGLVPMAAERIAGAAAFAGTPAETLYLADRGGLEGQRNREALKALTERPQPAFQAAFARGRQLRRSGEAEAAVGWLRRAAELRPDSFEALLELGNALFLFGDLEGARETYQRALDRAPERGEPHFNLARLFARRAQVGPREEAVEELARAKEFISSTIQLDPRLGLLAAGDIDMRANHLLAGASLDLTELRQLAVADGMPARVKEQASALLFGPLPAPWAPLASGLLGLGLLLFALIAGRLFTSSPCTKCGRPVCRRCDGEVAGPGLCGQCINVFNPRAAVDATSRAAKELGIRRYQTAVCWRARVAALLLSGAGHLLQGRTVAGLGWLGVVALAAAPLTPLAEALPAPLGGAPVVLRVAPAVLLLAGLHLWSVWRAWRHARVEAK